MGADQDIDWNRAAASALEWWRDAGVDMLVEDQPRDWLAAPAKAPSAPAQAAEPARVATLPANLIEFEQWRVGAQAPDTRWGTPIGPAGNAASGLMVLTDLPEREDAAAGRLLSGAPGALFDKMLAAIGRDRQSIYLAAFAVARPIAGRIAESEVDELARLSRHHIGLARPKRLLLLGNAVSRALLGADVPAARQNLHVVNHGAGQTEVVASFHPRFLLDHPARKAEAWRDLQMLIGGIDA